MNKSFYLLAAAAALASCRESNMAARSTPSTGEQARVTRLDTTFISGAPRPQAFRYVTALRVGRDAKTATIPVEIAWTATPGQGCPQVASVQVYQLNGDDRRTTLQASVKRDGTCRAGLGPDGKLGTATTGMALVTIAGRARDVRFATSTSCLINALGYHDSLNYDNASALR